MILACRNGRLKPLATCIAVLALLAAWACSHRAAAQNTAVYKNPILAQNFPDPSILRAADGWFYVYATQKFSGGELQHIQVARSKNLVDWEHLEDAMPREPSWAGRDFWAPHVVFDEARRQYFMYFSGEHDGEAVGKCIGVATSDSPTGPFQPASDPLKCGKDFVNIDPMAFDDPETGKHLLFWGSGFEPIKVRELAADRMHFKEGGEPKAVVAPGKDKDYNILIEGSWVIYRNGTYYLFYSGDNCCGENANYAVMVARAASATGPYERFGEANGTGSSAILEEKGFWEAPGHNSVIADSTGQDWIFYHAIHPNRRVKNTVENKEGPRRVMLMDRLVYENGWPRVEESKPSHSIEAAPVVTAGGR